MPRVPETQSRVAISRQPAGVRLSPAALGAPGEALAATGAAVANTGAALKKAEDRVNSRRDAVLRARAVGEFRSSANEELRRLETEDDLSRQDVVDNYNRFLAEQQKRLIGDHGGSQESIYSLDARLELMRGDFENVAASRSVAEQKRVVGEVLGESINTMAARVGERSDTLDASIVDLDEMIDDMAPALTPEAEEMYRDAGRQQLTMSAVTGLLNRGAWQEARDLIDDTPGIAEYLDPETRRSIDTRIAAFEQKEAEAATAGERKVTEAEQILGRPLTGAERITLAGVAPKAGTQSPADKIASIEEALGRPLTQGERERALDVEGGGAQTQAGKTVQDREMFVGQYGEDSDQVRAFDAYVAAEGDAPNLSDIGGIRKEFTGLSKDFVLVRDAFNRIAQIGRKPSAAGDLALIFNFMKMLDPGSTVREGEFANAQNTAGVSGRVRSMYNRVLTGERLNEDQRGDFLSRTEDLMRAQLGAQVRLEQQYRAIATRSKIANPDDVVVDFIGPLRQGVGEATEGEDDMTWRAPSAAPRITLDAEGNVVGEAGK